MLLYLHCHRRTFTG